MSNITITYSLTLLSYNYPAWPTNRLIHWYLQDYATQAIVAEASIPRGASNFPVCSVQVNYNTLQGADYTHAMRMIVGGQDQKSTALPTDLLGYSDVLKQYAQEATQQMGVLQSHQYPLQSITAGASQWYWKLDITAEAPLPPPPPPGPSTAAEEDEDDGYVYVTQLAEKAALEESKQDQSLRGDQERFVSSEVGEQRNLLGFNDIFSSLFPLIGGTDLVPIDQALSDDIRPKSTAEMNQTIDQSSYVNETDAQGSQQFRNSSQGNGTLEPQSDSVINRSENMTETMDYVSDKYGYVDDGFVPPLNVAGVPAQSEVIENFFGSHRVHTNQTSPNPDLFQHIGNYTVDLKRYRPEVLNAAREILEVSVADPIKRKDMMKAVVNMLDNQHTDPRYESGLRLSAEEVMRNPVLHAFIASHSDLKKFSENEWEHLNKFAHAERLQGLGRTHVGLPGFKYAEELGQFLGYVMTKPAELLDTPLRAIGQVLAYAGYADGPPNPATENIQLAVDVVRFASNFWAISSGVSAAQLAWQRTFDTPMAALSTPVALMTFTNLVGAHMARSYAPEISSAVAQRASEAFGNTTVSFLPNSVTETVKQGVALGALVAPQLSYITNMSLFKSAMIGMTAMSMLSAFAPEHSEIAYYGAAAGTQLALNYATEPFLRQNPLFYGAIKVMEGTQTALDLYSALSTGKAPENANMVAYGTGPVAMISAAYSVAVLSLAPNVYNALGAVNTALDKVTSSVDAGKLMIQGVKNSTRQFSLKFTSDFFNTVTQLPQFERAKVVQSFIDGILNLDLSTKSLVNAIGWAPKLSAEEAAAKREQVGNQLLTFTRDLAHKYFDNMAALTLQILSQQNQLSDMSIVMQDFFNQWGSKIDKFKRVIMPDPPKREMPHQRLPTSPAANLTYQLNQTPRTAAEVFSTPEMKAVLAPYTEYYDWSKDPLGWFWPPIKDTEDSWMNPYLPKEPFFSVNNPAAVARYKKYVKQVVMPKLARYAAAASGFSGEVVEQVAATHGNNKTTLLNKVSDVFSQYFDADTAAKLTAAGVTMYGVNRGLNYLTSDKKAIKAAEKGDRKLNETARVIVAAATDPTRVGVSNPAIAEHRVAPAVEDFARKNLRRRHTPTSVFAGGIEGARKRRILNEELEEDRFWLHQNKLGRHFEKMDERRLFGVRRR